MKIDVIPGNQSPTLPAATVTLDQAAYNQMAYIVSLVNDIMARPDLRLELLALAKLVRPDAYIPEIDSRH